MPKLSKEFLFIDLSDYGRSTAVLIARHFKDTLLTPVHITILFTITGLLAVYSILQNYFLIAGILLIIKSVLDALDGELSRVKNTPSYTGRYLDSICDILLNFLILTAIGFKTNSLFYSVIAFMSIQFQGTLFNYYYVILRNNSGSGDDTSRVFETKLPKAFECESQQTVNCLFYVYKILYGLFDYIIYLLDKPAAKINNFPDWFMTLVSLYGLGFQLLIISVMLNIGLIDYIIPFFIYYTALIGLIILIRKYFLDGKSWKAVNIPWNNRDKSVNHVLSINKKFQAVSNKPGVVSLEKPCKKSDEVNDVKSGDAQLTEDFEMIIFEEK